MADPSTRFFHSFVPHKHRLMMLIGFIRSHLNDSLVVACAGPNIATYLAILTNNLDLRSNAAESSTLVNTPSPNSTAVKGFQKHQERAEAIARFDSGEVNVLFASTFILSSLRLTKRPTWFVHFDIPKSPADELRLVRLVNPQKCLLLLDPSQSGYVGLLEKISVDSKLIPLDEKKLPNVRKEVAQLCKKNYPLYLSSELGYRELIEAYVNHEEGGVFVATELPVVDVASNFGLDAPPLLPLTK
jgi:hypothetical protein